MDSALNLAMAAQRELMEAVGRLRETEEELEDKKKKVLFLQKTRRVRIYGVIQTDVFSYSDTFLISQFPIL